MKQTVAILTALAAALLIVSGFIVAANADLYAEAVQREQELLDVRSQLAEHEKKMAQYEQENRTAAEALHKTTEERDALNEQLSTAVLTSQAANDAVAEQMRENERLRRELQDLAEEYEALSDACDALEGQVAQLGENAVQAASSHEAQSIRDAQRIAELEQALEKALAPAAAPSPAPSAAPQLKRRVPPVV